MGGISSGKTGVWAAVIVLAMCVLLLSRCTTCQGRKLPAGDEEGAGVVYFDGGLVLRVLPPPTSAGEEEEAVPRKFKAIPERFMRSVPSPGVGH
jgi:hypothetical protein